MPGHNKHAISLVELPFSLNLYLLAVIERSKFKFVGNASGFGHLGSKMFFGVVLLFNSVAFNAASKFRIYIRH